MIYKYLINNHIIKILFRLQRTYYFFSPFGHSHIPKSLSKSKYKNKNFSLCFCFHQHRLQGGKYIKNNREERQIDYTQKIKLSLI